MGYELLTKSGHNMFTMLSLLQKAVRRGDYQGAGYASSECFWKYHHILWKRILTISAEDCWGVVTKEIVALKYLDDKTGGKDKKYISQAVKILVDNKKSRDACYYACNFILGTIKEATMELDNSFIKQTQDDCNDLADDVFSVVNIGTKNNPYTKNESKEGELFEVPYLTMGIEWLMALLRKSIRTLDMENAGFAINHILENDKYEEIWKVLLVVAINECDNLPTKEIIALKLADDFVNKGKKFGKRDEIYISKSVMILMYYIDGTHETVCGSDRIKYEKIIDRTDDYDDIDECKLPNNEVPEWVYDVHTIRGKKAGKTDWGMNIVEFEALKPLQKGYFDDGDWSLRYEYKWEHKMCSEEEYKAMLEYKVGRVCNPVEKIADRF